MSFLSRRKFLFGKLCFSKIPPARSALISSCVVSAARPAQAPSLSWCRLTHLQRYPRTPVGRRNIPSKKKNASLKCVPFRSADERPPTAFSLLPVNKYPLYFFKRYFPISLFSVLSSSGFARCPSISATFAAAISSAKASAVIARIGTSRASSRPSARIFSAAV